VERTEYEHWGRIILAIAKQWMRLWAWQQNEALLEDCCGAGWEAIAKYGVENPRIRWEIRNAVQNEIILWLYQRTRGRGERHIELFPLSEIFEYPDPINIEQVVINRDFVRKLQQDLQDATKATRSKTFKVWEALALCYNPSGEVVLIDPLIAKEFKIGYRAIWRGKKKLRALLLALLERQ
jgi:hypothetical protein